MERAKVDEGRVRILGQQPSVSKLRVGKLVDAVRVSRGRVHDALRSFHAGHHLRKGRKTLAVEPAVVRVVDKDLRGPRVWPRGGVSNVPDAG